MTINPPRRVRVALYLVGVFLAPLVAYLYDRGVIGSAELALAGAWFAALNLLAAANVDTSAPAEPHGRHLE